MDDRPLEMSESIVIDSPLQDCFALFSKLDPTSYLHSDALIAKLLEITPLTDGDWNYPGAKQRLRFADGAQIEETLLTFQPNRQIAYEGRGFSQPIIGWTDRAQGRFEFKAVDEGTQLTWRYRFYLKDSAFKPAQAFIFQTVFLGLIYRRFMKKTLINIRQIVTLRSTVAGNLKASS